MISGSIGLTYSNSTTGSLSYINDLIVDATTSGSYFIVVSNKHMNQTMSNILIGTYGYSVQAKNNIGGSFTDYMISWGTITNPTPTPTPTPTPLPTSTPTPLPTSTPTPLPTSTPTPLPTSTPTPTPLPTDTPTPTPLPTDTPTPTPIGAVGFARTDSILATMSSVCNSNFVPRGTIYLSGTTIPTIGDYFYSNSACTIKATSARYKVLNNGKYYAVNIYTDGLITDVLDCSVTPTPTPTPTPTSTPDLTSTPTPLPTDTPTPLPTDTPTPTPTATGTPTATFSTSTIQAVRNTGAGTTTQTSGTTITVVGGIVTIKLKTWLTTGFGSSTSITIGSNTYSPTGTGLGESNAKSITFTLDVGVYDVTNWTVLAASSGSLTVAYAKLEQVI